MAQYVSCYIYKFIHKLYIVSCSIYSNANVIDMSTNFPERPQCSRHFSWALVPFALLLSLTIESSPSYFSSSSSKSTSLTNRGPLSAQRSPLEFDAMEKWPHLKLHHPKVPSNKRDGTRGNTTTTTINNVSNTLPSIQAFRCLNDRGP